MEVVLWFEKIHIYLQFISQHKTWLSMVFIGEHYWFWPLRHSAMALLIMYLLFTSHQTALEFSRSLRINRVFKTLQIFNSTTTKTWVT